MGSSRRPITKLSLYLHAMKTSFAICVILGVCFGIPMFILVPREGWVFAFLITLGFMIATIIFCAPLPLQGLSWIKKQENFFHFRFCEEMERDQIHQLPHSSGNWFLVAKKFKILALRRDFIVGLENYKEHYDYGTLKAEIIIVGADGKKRKMRSPDARIISELQQWFDLSTENR